MKVKTGDNVKVIHGKDHGKTGKIVQVLFNKRKAQYYVVVDGVNILKKHIRARGGQKGQIIELPAPIHISNVMLIDSKSDKPVRVGYKVEGASKKRINKKTGDIIE